MTQKNPALARTPPTSRLKQYFSMDNRYLAPALITSILLGAHLSFGILESYPQTLLAIASAILAELALSRLVAGRWPHLASAYISGISVGILIRSPAYWPFALCALISITSKYAIRWRDRHLWNPSNLGVSAMLFLAPETVAVLSIQWGNNLWPMLIIWCLGAFTIHRLKRFHICLTYIISFLVFGLIRSAITGHPYAASIAPLTGPMYQLFIFFMITDPRTTVGTRRGRIIVTILIAFVEMILRLNEIVYAPFYALFVVGPPAFAIDLWRAPSKPA